MAKDPAVLWFFGDWQGGTMTLSRHLKGCYMDLLCAQFNSGPLSPEEIKTVLGNDFAAWQGSLSKKFKKTDSGMFYNERLEAEIKKRRAYSESRRKNLSSKSSQPTPLHMDAHMENENRIGIEMNDEEKKALLTEFQTQALASKVWVDAVCTQNNISMKDVSKRTSEFNVHVIAGGVAVSNLKEYKSWFRNWLLNKNYLNGKSTGALFQKNVFASPTDPYRDYCPEEWDEGFYKRIQSENYADRKMAAYEQKLRRNGYKKQGDQWVKII